MTEPEDVVFDSSACYAHSEFELGMMKMFGGFGSGFLTEYHQLVAKAEPIDEYEDRVALYELCAVIDGLEGSQRRHGAHMPPKSRPRPSYRYLYLDKHANSSTPEYRYHHLNHHALFGGGYDRS